jgi:hypothetical protein
MDGLSRSLRSSRARRAARQLRLRLVETFRQGDGRPNTLLY